MPQSGKQLAFAQPPTTASEWRFTARRVYCMLGKVGLCRGNSNHPLTYWVGLEENTTPQSGIEAKLARAPTLTASEWRCSQQKNDTARPEEGRAARRGLGSPDPIGFWSVALSALLS
eukprot:3738245-Rhodomonas_salina.1